MICCRAEQSTEEKQKKKKRRKELQDETAFDEDIVEDFILSSDGEDGSVSDTPSDEEVSIKQKSSVEPSKKKGKSHGKKNRKRKRSKAVASAV